MRIQSDPFPLETELPAPRMCTVEEVMARDVVSVRVDVSAQAVAELLLDRRISGVPVVDRDRCVVGMISKTDLLREQLEVEDGDDVVTLRPGLQLEPGRTAGDVMTPDVVCIPEGSSLTHAAMVMTRLGIHRVPVVSSEGRLVGQVSASDILRWVSGLP